MLHLPPSCARFLQTYGFHICFRFSKVLAGLESSGRLVGKLTTNPGIYQSQGAEMCKVMAENFDRIKVSFSGCLPSFPGLGEGFQSF